MRVEASERLETKPDARVTKPFSEATPRFGRARKESEELCGQSPEAQKRVGPS